MKHFLKKKIFYILFTAAVTVILAFFIKNNLNYLEKIPEINPFLLVAILILCPINRFFNGLKLKIIMEVFSIKLSFKEWYGLAVINNFYNYFVSKSGTAAFAAYMKKMHGFAFSNFISLLLGDTVVALLSSSMLGISAALYGLSSGNLDNRTVVVLFFMMGLLACFLIAFPRVRFPEYGIMAKLNKVLEGWDLLTRNFVLIIKLLFTYLAMMAVFALRYYIIFQVFSSKVPFFVCLMLAPLNYMVQIVSIVPGAYGLREVVAGFITKITHFGFVPGAMATLIDRAIVMLVAFAQGTVFSYLLIKKTGVKIKEEKE